MTDQAAFASVGAGTFLVGELVSLRRSMVGGTLAPFLYHSAWQPMLEVPQGGRRHG